MKIRKYWESHFLIFELITAIIIVIIFVIWSEYLGGKPVINNYLINIRKDMYGALAAVFGSLLGFCITSVSIVIGYASNDKFAIIKQSKHYTDLWKVFNQTMKVLALTTIISILGLIVDKDSSPQIIIFYITTFFVILSFFRISRCIWVLENIIKIVAK